MTVWPVSSTSQQLQFARAISAQRRARLLAPDNSASDPVPLADAVASGKAYFVTPRSDLLVVDADLPDDADAAAHRAAAFDLLIEAADRCGVPHVVVASGRDGHRHGYLLVGMGRSRLMVEEWCRARGLDLRDRGVRPPGSPHRDGRHVAVPIVPHDPSQVLAVLSRPVDVDAANRLGRRLMPIELPARITSALRHGHGAAGYESPSHARMALAVAVRSRSGPRSLMEMLLGDRSSPLGQTYRTRPTRWQHQEVRRLWDKAGEWIAQRPSVGPLVLEVDRFADALAGHRWAGMAGGTDLAVAEAFLALARRVGTTSVGFALADLGVAAGVSYDTARASVRRLLAAGWLSVVAEATPRTSRVYRLRVPAEAARRAASAAALPGRTGVGPWSDLGGDLARWRGLGKVTMRLARLLSLGDVLTVEEIASHLRMRAAAVRYHLRKLARYDGAAKVGRAWMLTLTADDASALEVGLGVSGRRDRQRAQVLDMRARRATLLHGYRMAWLAGRRAGRDANTFSHHDGYSGRPGARGSDVGDLDGLALSA